MQAHIIQENTNWQTHQTDLSTVKWTLYKWRNIDNNCFKMYPTFRYQQSFLRQCCSYTVSTKKLHVQHCIRCHNSGKQRRILTKFYTNTVRLNCKQVTNWLIEHGFTSAPTQYRLYGRRFFTGLMTQPTVSKHWRRVVSQPDRPQSNQAHLTVLQYYNMHADIIQENTLTHRK